MGTVQIQQNFSSSAHPALLSDEDIDLLGLWENTPAGTHLEQPSLSPLSLSKRSSDRHDAGVLTIVITFTLGAIAGGALQEAGKDLYAWVKTHLIELMNRKREAVKSSTSAYPFKVPEWELEIIAKHGDTEGFTASVKATSAESMEQAMRKLAESLKDNASTLDLPHQIYYWNCSQTVAGLHLRSNIHEPGTK